MLLIRPVPSPPLLWVLHRTPTYLPISSPVVPFIAHERVGSLLPRSAQERGARRVIPMPIPEHAPGNLCRWPRSRCARYDPIRPGCAPEPTRLMPCEHGGTRARRQAAPRLHPGTRRGCRCECAIRQEISNPLTMKATLFARLAMWPLPGLATGLHWKTIITTYDRYEYATATVDGLTAGPELVSCHATNGQRCGGRRTSN